MAFDPVAQARIELELNDDALVQGLHRVGREHARTMREIDRSRAEATVDIDTSHYDDAIKNVRRELKKLDGEKATGSLDLDDKEFKAKVKALRKELRALEGQKATVELELRGEDAFKKASKRAQQAAQKDIEATERAEQRRQNLYEQAEKRRLAGVRNEARVLASLNKQREREMASSHTEALRMDKERVQSFVREGNVRMALMRREQQHARETEKAASARQKELESIPRLQREYADLTLKLEQLAAARRKAFPDKRAQLVVDLKVAETEAKLAALEAQLKVIGEPVDVRINFKTGTALGADLRKSVMAGGGFAGAGVTLGKGLGRGMLNGFKDTFTPKNMLSRGMNTLTKFGHMLGSISEATVRIGPFTASIRTLMIALTVLGPTIVDLVGALGSLVGVTGTGLVGAMALGAGAVSAFGVALGGVGFLIPTLLKDFKNLTTIQNAYHTAVLKNGANSSKAAQRLEEFNNALKGVQPTTREAFLSLSKIQDNWNKMAQDVKPEFFDAMGASLEVVNHHWAWFADNTKRSFTILTDGWQAWMKGLRSDEAGTILRTLGTNGRESLRPLMDALGNLVTWFGRIAAESSNYLPGIVRGFRDWTQALADGVGPSTNLGDKIERLVDHTKALGGFLMSATRFLISFFDAGADSGAGFLETMTAALDRWTEFNQSTAGREKLTEFFDRSVKGAQALYSALAPIVQTFVAWAEQISPMVTDFLRGAGAVSSFVGGFVRLVGLQDSLSAIVTTLGAIWAVGRIRAATTAVTAFSTALLGMGAAGGAASAGGAAAAAGRGGLFASMLGMGAGATRIIGPAEKTWANMLRTVGLGAVKKAGLIGVGIAAMELIGKGFGTVRAREGFKSSALGLSRDLYSTITLGAVDTAEQKSAEAAKLIVGSLRRNVDLELDKNVTLKKKKINWLTFSVKDLFDNTSTLDLTIDQKKMARQFQLALQKADQIVRDHHMRDITVAVRATADPKDLQTIENNWNRLKNNLATTNKTIRKNTDETLAAMGRSMDLNTQRGTEAVEKNFSLTALAIKRNMANGRTSVHDGMTEIRRQFRIHSQAARKSADVNFGAAKSAIQMAVKDGQVSSERGLREIRKLWVSYLKLYGFSEKEAQNEASGKRYDGGPQEGSRGPRGDGTMRARGGLVNVGTPGTRAHDSVPMNLNGQPSVVAPGEQIAVFNRHQQKAANQYLPGGLEGFFAQNKKPHYAARGGLVGYAGGGIVPVPGFPGESAAASVIPMILKIARTFGLILTDAFGSGHQSPGHTQTGTAADFAGPDRSMDAAVKSLVAAGYLVGYDGRFGSADWPGHGPAAGQGGDNAHLHVELGGKNAGGTIAGFEAETIKRQMAAQGLGTVTTVVQRGLDVALAAAQSNLDSVAAASLSQAVSGGMGASVNEGQVRSWIAQGLRVASQAVNDASINKLYGRVMQESGGNPRAQNNWDSNAKAGHPSKGILQTIDSTFNTYKVPGHNDIWNPIDNIAAAVRYMLATYHQLVGASGSGYAMGGLVTMGQDDWARGGKVERPTLMTGEDGKKAPEYIIGTNPSFRKNNIQALTNAANALGVPMARKSKTGTIRPHLIGSSGKDPDNLSEVKHYAAIQKKEEDKKRDISIAESKVKEPDTLIKQQGTDAVGNPLFVVDQAKLDGWVKQMKAVKALYDDLIKRIMASLMATAKKAYAQLTKYRDQRTSNIHALDAQNAVNKRLMKSKDEHTREAAERRYNAGLDMRDDQIQLRTDAAGVRDRIADDQHDAGYRVQEYRITRQSVVDDIRAAGTKAAEDAVSETQSAFKEPESPPDLPSPGEAATSRLETELALSQAGYGMNGQLGSQRVTPDIINDLIAANQTVIAENQTLLNDADVTNDESAYTAITQAANAIKGLREDLTQNQADPATEYHTFGSAMLDMYRQFGSNMFGPSSAGMAGGNAAARYLGAGGTTTIGGQTVASDSGNVINIEQNFPTQPDPMTWARSTLFELNAAL